MSDDLKKRLRQHRYNTWNDDLGPEPDKALAADRIEQLERELEVAVWYRAAWDQAMLQRNEAEAKLAQALSLVEDAFCEGFSEGYDGGWIGGDYTPAWKKSDVKAELEKPNDV